MDATIALMLIEALLILLGIAISKAIRFISVHPVAFDDSCHKDAVVLISTDSCPSSHIIVAPPATKYDVFLSFRGEDTRDTFASYLYKELRNADIHTFMDHKLHKGEQISQFILRTIEESKISVIVFSGDYASSTWCMDELVQILECKDKYGRVVIPIFYNVDPSNVRKQNGTFGDGFAKLKQRFKDNQHKVKKWRKALILATCLSGWNSRNIKPEFKFIEEIVKDILCKLKYCKPSCNFEGLVGIAHRVENIEEYLFANRIVGIWGMGGVGKTTLAKAVFHKLKAQFEAFSFIKNVRERIAVNGLDELQKECLKELLKDEDINIYDIRSPFVKSRLRYKKILLVLDDVDNSVAVKELVKVCNWFGEESRMIITSRDMQVLKNASAKTYHVQGLDFHEAFHLFILKAFKQNEPFQSYLEISTWVVDYCQGNPLALIVLGCFLHDRTKEEWESAWEKLMQDPPEEVFNVLKLSFDGLDDKQKNMFLDLAFFIKRRISLNEIRHLYGSSLHIEISVLKERSLISVNEEGVIEMHDLVRKMGLEVARQQSFSIPKSPVRLWRHEDIYNYFINNKGIEAIRCISLDISKMKRITLRASNFKEMYNLIFLEVYNSDWGKRSKLNICENLDYLPEELRFFCWEGYPLPTVPLRFCAENLVHLIMPCSHLQQLWEGDQHFPNLQLIDVSFSENLIGLPDLSQAPNIRNIFLNKCVNLSQIHSSTLLGKLTALSVYGGQGPRHINIGPNIEERSGWGFMTVYNYVDQNNLSFNEVTVKLLVSNGGNMISGIRFKHEIMPLREIPDQYRDNMSLGFWCCVRTGYWSDCPSGNENFKQHINYQLSCNGGKTLEGESSSSNTLTSVPDNMTGLSLLTELRLQENDVNESWSIPQDSIFQSLEGFEHCQRLQPVMDLTISLDVPATDWLAREFFVAYSSHEWNMLTLGLRIDDANVALSFLDPTK